MPFILHKSFAKTDYLPGEGTHEHDKFYRVLTRILRDGLGSGGWFLKHSSLKRRQDCQPFSVRRHFSEQEIEFFSNVDLVTRVALAVVAEEGGRPVIVGGGRYVVVEPERAKVAFALIDEFQGKGIGGALMRHLAALAREAGLKELIAQGATREHCRAPGSERAAA
jgi:GNAT superfamily N-acetyltransferase